MPQNSSFLTCDKRAIAEAKRRSATAEREAAGVHEKREFVVANLIVSQCEILCEDMHDHKMPFMMFKVRQKLSGSVQQRSNCSSAKSMVRIRLQALCMVNNTLLKPKNAKEGEAYRFLQNVSRFGRLPVC